MERVIDLYGSAIALERWTRLPVRESLTELEDLVDNKGLTFGMNVSKYKLDKE